MDKDHVVSSELNNLFLLEEAITYLNHGSYGACPKPVFDNYQNWQRKLEAEPVRFITEEGPMLLDKSKEALGEYIGCSSDDLVYTTNPTYAINIIVKSLDLSAGDEILTTDHEYGAMNRTWDYYCQKKGAKVIRQKILLPVTSKEQVITQFFKGLSSKTKAIFISHITSPTALIFPVEEICERAKELGLLTIVDGAHVPGHIPLDLFTLKADIYTGACHKWMLAPKGCAFLYVRKDIQDQFDPLLISWGYQSDNPGPSRFLDYHQMQGTRDFSAFLTMPAAIEFLKKHNWNEVAKSCRELIRKYYPILCEKMQTEPICSVDETLIGQMCTIPINININEVDKLKKDLMVKYKIEIPVISFNNQSYVRLSLNAYNSKKDIDHLSVALGELIPK